MNEWIHGFSSVEPEAAPADNYSSEFGIFRLIFLSESRVWWLQSRKNLSMKHWGFGWFQSMLNQQELCPVMGWEADSPRATALGGVAPWVGADEGLPMAVLAVGYPWMLNSPWKYWEPQFLCRFRGEQVPCTPETFAKRPGLVNATLNLTKQWKISIPNG